MTDSHNRFSITSAQRVLRDTTDKSGVWGADLLKPTARTLTASANARMAVEASIEATTEASTGATTPKQAPSQQPQQPRKQVRPLASVDHPLIQAVLGGRFRFPTREQAIARLQNIRQQFPTIEDIKAYKKYGHDNDVNPHDLNITPSIVIWVRGYAITPQEDSGNFIGNFLEITLEQLEDQNRYWTLVASKLEMPIGEHPQKKMNKMAHPNWGHFILRGVGGKKIYASVEEARDDLAKLHFQYPDTSIPATEDKMHLIVYDRTEKPPIRKVVLYVKPNADGTATLEVQKKTKKGGGPSKKSELNNDEMASALNDAGLGR